MMASAFIPGWVTLPAAALCMITIAAHLLVVERRTRNELRRRIRLANGWVMLIAVPLVAAGFSYIDPNTKPRMFLIVWLCIFGLVLVSIALAFADMANTVIAARKNAVELRAARRALDVEAESRLKEAFPEQFDGE